METELVRSQAKFYLMEEREPKRGFEEHLLNILCYRMQCDKTTENPVTDSLICWEEKSGLKATMRTPKDITQHWTNYNLAKVLT